MQKTINYDLNKPEENDYADISVLNENADTIDAALDELEQGKQPVGDYATKTELSQGLAGKQPTGDYATTAALTALDNEKADKATTLSGYGITDGATKTELQAVNEKSIATLTHTKSGTVHRLVGMTGKSGLVSCKFKATAAFTAGNTFTIDGVSYTAKLANGKALAANQFVSGALVDCVVDTVGKAVNFKSGGVDVSAATATETDVLAGRSFFAGLDSLRVGTLDKGYKVIKGKVTLPIYATVHVSLPFKASVILVISDVIMATYQEQNPYANAFYTPPVGRGAGAIKNISTTGFDFDNNITGLNTTIIDYTAFGKE